MRNLNGNDESALDGFGGEVEYNAHGLPPSSSFFQVWPKHCILKIGGAPWQGLFTSGPETGTDNGLDTGSRNPILLFHVQKSISKISMLAAMGNVLNRDTLALTT